MWQKPAAEPARWANDQSFQDTAVAKVETHDGGWVITRSDGWSLFISSSSPVTPKPGMALRTYGRGIGFPFRGILLDGACVFYRTEDEDREHQDVERYGADAADLLARWDDGRSVWTVAMGGIGPGCEQAIQVAMFEVLRHLVTTQPGRGWGEDEEQRTAIRSAIEADVLPIVDPLGLSGAQWGAALSLATALYFRGPRVVMAEVESDRRTLVSRVFPGIAPRASQPVEAA